jgi:hypothetical protein
MHPADREWYQYAREVNSRIDQFMNSYITNIEQIAPAPLVDAAIKFRDGLRSPVLSRGEYRVLVEAFASELEKVASPTQSAE